MKHQINTIREALEFFECGSYSTSKALTAITAFAQLEAMVGEQEQSLAFYKRRCDALQQWQSKMRDPERTIVCDILANGHTLEPAGNRYAAPPAQPQYEAGDMASAHNDGFRAGVASVAQQPQAEAVPDAMKVVLEAMRSDPDYAWSWHCNVAMAFYDAGGDIYTANQGAARFMRMLADVEPAHELPAAPQQAEAVHNKPVRVCHIKDVACSEAAVKCGECPDAAPQQAETVPSDVVRDAERYRWLRNESWAGYNTGKGTPSVYTVDGAGNRRMMLAEEAMDAAIDAAIAAQGEKPCVI